MSNPEFKIDKSKIKQRDRVNEGVPQIVCSHCGKEYSSDLKYCPDCSEATSVSESKQRLGEREQKKHTLAFAVETAKLFIGIAAISVVGACFARFCEIVNEDIFGNFFVWFIVFFAFCSIFAVRVTIDRKKDMKWQNRMAKFHADNTSICPECGSHDLSFGRKGYDWNYAYWGSVFKIKGSQYLAGMDSRRVTAHCNKCGHRWETSKEWLR